MEEVLAMKMIEKSFAVHPVRRDSNVELALPIYTLFFAFLKLFMCVFVEKFFFLQNQIIFDFNQTQMNLCCWLKPLIGSTCHVSPHAIMSQLI